MFSFFDDNMQSNMCKKIGADATMTFYPQEHLQGHKVDIFNMICLAIVGENAQQRKVAGQTTLHCYLLSFNTLDHWEWVVITNNFRTI